MFGYSLPLLFGRLFGIPLFVLGVVFLLNYRHDDRPKAMLKKSLRNPWVWLFLILAWIGFGFEVVTVSNRGAS
jgi:predicted permease